MSNYLGHIECLSKLQEFGNEHLGGHENDYYNVADLNGEVNVLSKVRPTLGKNPSDSRYKLEDFIPVTG